jgi:gliding motility-associated-like protein
VKYIVLIIATVTFVGYNSNAQNLQTGFSGNINFLKSENNTYSFIENIGQYGNVLYGFESMGEIKFGYEGFQMPVLFTPKGLIFLQRKISPLTQSQEKEFDNQGILEGDIEKKRNITERFIIMEWSGADPNAEIIKEYKTTSYNTYGIIQNKAYGYRKITYRNIYPGIDVVYTFTGEAKAGFEYSLILKAGSDLKMVKLKYGGNTQSISINKEGNLIVRSDIGEIMNSVPVSYYPSDQESNHSGKVNSAYTIINNETSFYFPQGYDKTKAMVIDPFISSTSNLTGGATNSGKAKDIDFDYDGNVYVTGGGTNAFHKLAKYDSLGNLLWTFNGSLTTPAWVFGSSYGGWAVEKSTGKIYLGQGFNVNSQVIRLDQSGLYDNYISAANTNFRENWKIIWNCVNGNPQLLIGGGTTLSNMNFTTLSPPSVNTIPLNITGLAGITQDIADMIIDPINNDMYTIYASKSTPSISNMIFKHTYPYISATIAWQVPSGYNTLKEADNKPYLEQTSLLPGFNTTDNAINLFAINSNYLFYWDGKNLKAINKTTGADVGPPLISPLLAKWQGGIYADECGNVFTGYNNGKIKVYKFNGTNFDDNAAPDISIPGFSTKNVYDLVYNSANKLLYACGNGFVASFDISSYCPGNSLFSVIVTPDCVNNKATAIIAPSAPPGSVVTYSLFLGANFLASNTTGIFTGLSNSTLYTVKATINQNCSGIQAANTTFSYPYCPPFTTTVTHTTCGNNNGSLTVVAFYGSGPYLFSLDGVNFQISNIFLNLNSGFYTVTVKDALGEIKTKADTINVSQPISVITSKSDATCGLSNGTISIMASGGSGGYSYSLDSINYQSNNTFISLSPGNYRIYIKDTVNCNTSVLIQINGITPPSVNIMSTIVSCTNNDGLITANGSDGSPPYTFSMNGGIYQISNSFPGLSAGVYIIRIKDAAGCIVPSQPVNIVLNNNISVSISNPLPICFGGSTVINASTNANISSWFPVTGLSNPMILQPTASPLATTKYFLTVSSGVCSKMDSVTVFVNPPPVSDAGLPDTICYGQKNVQLNGSGGVNYLWSPSIYLSSATAQNPVLINPVSSVTYSLSVSDASKCWSATNASVRITVLQPAKVFAGNDTSVVFNQPLQLHAAVADPSTNIFNWTPATGLNFSNISDPIARLNTGTGASVMYVVRATNAAGCFGEDNILVTVYKTGPEIFVPTAFTPNGDGLNDFIAPICVGIKKLEFFRIYKRPGQLIFSTSQIGKGWDGKINGVLQDNATLVYYAQAVDYLGKLISKKGTFTLIK